MKFYEFDRHTEGDLWSV